MSNTIGNTENLDTVIANYLKRIDRGEHVDRERFKQAHANLAHELQAFFEDLDCIGRHVDTQTFADADTSDQLTRTSTGREVPSSFIRLDANHTVDGAAGIRLSFGDYDLLQELGRGGMGIVFKAQQRSLNRTVCIKMMLMAELADAEDFQRFRAEAMAIARVRHPGIVAIHEVGQHNGTPYYTMEFVKGVALTKFVSDTLLPAAKAADYVRQIADAVHVAHENGIVHRDLKPSNILVDGQDHTHITDFGVAKQLEADEELTVTGQVLGTPSYMAPEQAAARRGAIGPGTDIYAAGAILYALLTGRPPHRADDALETVRLVISEPPINPGVLNAGIPTDLVTICMKCLEKSPAARYPTARHLADDLQRYLAGKPIQARPMGIPGRAARWVRRHPTAAISAACLVLLVIGTTVGLTQYAKNTARINARLQELVTEKDEALTTARRNELTARNLQYVSDMQLVEPYATEGDYRSSMSLLDNNIPPPGKPDLRGFEWHVLRQRQRRTGHVIAEITAPLYCVCVSPDGRWLATGGQDAVIRFYDLESTPHTSPTVVEIPTEHGEINGLAFSSRGLRLATAGDDGHIRVWDLECRRLQLDFMAHPGAAFNVAFVQDDSSLLTCGEENALRVWDAESGASKGQTTGPFDVCDAFSLTADRQDVWHVGSDGFCRHVDLETLQHTGPQFRHVKRPTCVAVTPDGQLVVSGENGSQLLACNAATGKVDSIKTSHAIQSVAISPDGLLLAAGDRNGSIRIWGIRKTDEAACGYAMEADTGWFAHEGRVYGLAFFQDGDLLVSVGADGATREWDVERLAARDDFFSWSAGNSESENSFQFLPQSALLISANLEVGLEFWDCSKRETKPSTVIPFNNAQCVGASPDGTLFAAGSSKGVVAVWSRFGEEPIYTWNLEREVSQIVFAPHNDYVAVVTWQFDSAFRQTQLFRLSDGTPVFATPLKNWRHVAFSPREPILYVALDEQDYIIEWQLDSKMPRRVFNNHDSTIRHMKVSPGGTYVVSVSNDRSVNVYNTQELTESKISTGLLGQAEALLMGPRDKSIAVADSLGVVRACNLRAAKRVVDLLRLFEPGSHSGFALSSDARYLVARKQGEFHLYDLVTPTK